MKLAISPQNQPTHAKVDLETFVFSAEQLFLGTVFCSSDAGRSFAYGAYLEALSVHAEKIMEGQHPAEESITSHVVGREEMFPILTVPSERQTFCLLSREWVFPVIEF